MRLAYETKESRERDGEIRDLLEAHWKNRYKILLTSPQCRFDAFICKAGKSPAISKAIGKPSYSAVALLEIKKRSHPYGSYPSVIISLSKWQHLLFCREWMSKPEVGEDGKAIPLDVVIAIQWSDRLGYYKFDELHEAEGALKVQEKGGRTKQTRDRWDIEDVIHIPIELFFDVNVNKD